MPKANKDACRNARVQLSVLTAEISAAVKLGTVTPSLLYRIATVREFLELVEEQLPSDRGRGRPTKDEVEYVRFLETL